MPGREGYPLMFGTAALAVVLFGVALRARSWPLWLLAFVMTIVALVMAWSLRNLSPA